MSTFNDWPERVIDIQKIWQFLPPAQYPVGEESKFKKFWIKSEAYNNLQPKVKLLEAAGKAFYQMRNDLLAANGFNLKITGSFRTIEEAVREFKNRYRPTPPYLNANYNLGKLNNKYFSDSIWKDIEFQNNPGQPVLDSNNAYKAFDYIKNFQYLTNRTVKLVLNTVSYSRPSVHPIMPAGVPLSFIVNFVGNDFIKYWYNDPEKPGGRWWYMIEGQNTQLSTPGRSLHSYGIAVDLNSKLFDGTNTASIDWMTSNMLKYGWSREYGVNQASDPYHIVYYPIDKITPIKFYKPSIKNPPTPPKNSTTKITPKTTDKSITVPKSTDIINASYKTPIKISNLAANTPSNTVSITNTNFNSVKNTNLIQRFS